MEPGQLTSDEESVIQAIAGLEAAGQPASLESIADRAGLTAGKARVVLSRLLGELGLVHEIEEGPLGPYFGLSGRAGTQPVGAPAQEVDLDSVRLAGDLERYLASLEFPATTEDVIEASTGAATPQALVQALRRLPPDRTYVTLQDLAEELRAQL
jgi:hypothetical protein